MTSDDSGASPLTESEVREIVRDELEALDEDGATRRGLLAALGVAGASGLVGGRADAGTGEEAAAGARTGISVEDDGSTVAEAAGQLNLGSNLGGNGDGDRVTVDAHRGVDVVGPDGTSTSASTIEVGAGLDVAAEEGTVTITRSERSLPDGTYVATPGDLQPTLDDAAEDDVGAVRLVSGEVYERTSPVRVPTGVVLDCTGAIVEARSDVDVFGLVSRSQVRYPRVRTTGVEGYSSSVFHVCPMRYADDAGPGVSMPLWTVYGGWTEMTPGEGTCIDLHGVRQNPGGEYDPSEHNWNVYYAHVAHNCVGGRRFAHLHREGGDTATGGHVNANVVEGFARGATRFVETDDTAGDRNNMVNGNKFYLATQPGPDTEWLWLARKGKFNELYEWGANWDYYQYSDIDGDGYGDVWYIGPDADANFLWRRPNSASGGLGGVVVDDSNGNSGSRFLTLESLGARVEDLPIWPDAE